MFKFNMSVAEKDSKGYYATQWGSCAQVTVYATTKEDATQKVKGMMGNPSGNYDSWAVILQSVEEVYEEV
jgi:hypothetical protein